MVPVAPLGYAGCDLWGRPDSTWVAKLQLRIEVVEVLVKLFCKLIVANDSNYALAA
jgi:hypothetical protein